ncbi:VOC family protein [Arthrobacter sp. UKPF54-2]|uniref:VOC family protein n=1 Tax=Arthrobacter sp. UKPF54-2 TaxID=2600159 RepID=UPI0011B1931A|nr:VOC family protein [Arthrobacter sp. UKPF54-2]QDY89331.1 VOC family protein [Arthrobacter sp. UKPF54-2]
MLRVRPIHFTSRPDQWERLLEDLGMVKTGDEPTWREFDAGAGRLALHVVEAAAAEDGTTAFGVEAGDLAEFARRTNVAGAGTAPGTTAELIETDRGPSCRVTAADGFSFLADPATRAADGSWAGSAEAEADLAVVGVWFAADPTAAARTLRDIGARPRPLAGAAGTGGAEADAVETETFTAKNGGVLMVGAAGAAAGTGSAGLGFEYGGNLEGLRERLAGAGHEVALVEEAAVALLHVGNPDAGGAAHPHALWISAAPAGGRPV